MARKPYRPAVHVLARNIRGVWDAATDDDHAAGATWYADARRAAVALDPTDPDRAAGVIAALSPQQSWQRNLAMARNLYDGEPEPLQTTRVNADKARRILAGENPLDVLGGAKVRAFYANIIGDPNAVTVDRHAVDAARGRVGAYATHDTSSRYVHAAFVAAYTRVAAEVGATPAEVQATVWVAWRRIHDKSTHRADVAARADLAVRQEVAA